MAIKRHKWELIASDGDGAALARDGERLLFLMEEDWPIAVDVSAVE